MRFDIKDSLISGQPLYLLYSNRKSLPAVPAFIEASFPTQATGSVRLQVTGSPPTISGARFASLSAAHPSRLSGSDAAIAASNSCRRPKVCALTWIAWADGRPRIGTGGSLAHEYIVF